jgi:prepilin-type N-terminal cleavage/methylation domain-containing protein
MKRTGKKGFTIVELLTVMGVIAVLIGLLVPALGLVRDYAKTLQQKAQFHSIGVGLEMFKTEFGQYPDSSDNLETGKETTAAYCGANKLAEAIVGLDMLGFHPNADFYSDGTNFVTLNTGITSANPVNVYNTQGTANWQTGQENIQARKGPYMDLENANAFRMNEVYRNVGTNFLANFVTYNAVSGTTQNVYPLVLCDVYARKRSGLGGKKTGSPILYYRARTNFTQQDVSDVNGYADDIYNFDDNINLLDLGMPDDATQFSVDNGIGGNSYEKFENMIINDQVQSIRRPYKADTYILISAGKDGDFGTADDIYNFDKGVTE